jgi:tetratricopeptide (TPR) repeat protein
MILAAGIVLPAVPLSAQAAADGQTGSQGPDWKPFNGPEFGQRPKSTPSWVYYQEGKRYFAEGEFGKALVSYRKAIELQPEKKFPEAELGIGLVYEKEGESSLAIHHISQAIALRQLFYIPQDYYSALYALAQIHKRAENYRRYEDDLVAIVEDDERFSNPELAMSRPAYRNTLEEDGLNKLVLLYRLPDDFSLQAHTDLGIFYVSTGKYSAAADHLMFSTLKIISQGIEEVLRLEPDYEFTTMRDFLDRAQKIPLVENYLHSRNLFQNLYYLAAALYGQNFTDRARSIWELVASRPEAQGWVAKARSRIQHPRLEPLLDIGQ